MPRLHYFARMARYGLIMGLSRLFRRGELFAICRAALEDAGQPLDTRELSKAVAIAKGLDEQDRVLRKALALAIVNVMARQAKRGVIDGAERRRGVRIWHQIAQFRLLQDCE